MARIYLEKEDSPGYAFMSGFNQGKDRAAQAKKAEKDDFRESQRFDWQKDAASRAAEDALFQRKKNLQESYLTPVKDEATGSISDYAPDTQRIELARKAVQDMYPGMNTQNLSPTAMDRLLNSAGSQYKSPLELQQQKANLAKTYSEIEKGKAEAKSPKFTADQSKSAGFARAAEQAEKVFQELEAGGYNRASAGEATRNAAQDIPLVGGILGPMVKSDQGKRQEQAERAFVNAVLRPESGASISPAEFENARVQYFPRAGDTDEVRRQKAANRAQKIESLRASSGGALGNVPLMAPKGAGPKPGDVVDGYVYVNGDPGNPASWKKQ